MSAEAASSEHTSAEAPIIECMSAEAASSSFIDATIQVCTDGTEDEVQIGMRSMPRLARGLPDLSLAAVQGHALAERQEVNPLAVAHAFTDAARIYVVA